MAYNKKRIFKQAKDMIVKHKLFFIEDVVAFLPISKKTFYEYYPVESDESNELKELLSLNKTELKVSMRSKWYKSNSPALQMALYKLTASQEELKKLSMQFNDHTTDGEKLPASTPTAINVTIVQPIDEDE
jgi:gentisate 1,2-dioxygenase